MFGASLPGMAVLNTFPFLAGALIDDRKMTAAAAGALLSLELLASAVAALTASALARRLPPRPSGLSGCLLFAMGNLAAVQAEGWLLAAARLLAGAGGGLALAAAGRAMAMSTAPTKLGADIAILLAALGGAVALGAGLTIDRFGFAGGCLFLAAAALSATPFVARLPDPGVAIQSGAAGRLDWRVAVPLLGATGIAFLTGGAVWSYCERIGLAAGLSAKAVTMAVGSTAALGAAAAAAARVLASVRPLAVGGAGLLVFGASAAALSASREPLHYILALSALSFAFIFVWPFILGAAVEADKSGRLASAAYGVQMLAGALAPLAGGVLIGAGALDRLAAAALVSGAAAAGGLVVAGRRNRQARLRDHSS